MITVRAQKPVQSRSLTRNTIGGQAISTSKWLLIGPLTGALGVGAGLGADKLFGAAAQGEARQDVKQAVTLPITHILLFNSGVGYFSRSGEVTDDARADLTFPEQDVNDLLKSMVLEGLGKIIRTQCRQSTT